MIRTVGIVVLVVGLHLSGISRLQAQITPELRPGDVVLVGGSVFTGLGDDLEPNPGILVRNGTILLVGLELNALPTGVQLLRLEDEQTVLPGFFDLHAHYAIDLFGEGRVDEYTVNPVVFLANGVTSTFPAGEVDPEGMRSARERIGSGEQVGARIYNSGPYFGTARPGWNADRMTPDSIEAEVDLWASRGARGFKAKGIRPGQLAALISAAHRHGLPVTAHLDSGARGSVNPRDAIMMGIDRIEHFLGGDAMPSERSAYASLEALDVEDPVTQRQLAEVFDVYKTYGVFFDATVTAYGYFGAKDPAVYTKWIDEMSFLTPYGREVAEEGIARRGVSEQFERIYHVKHRTLKAFYDAGGGGLITLGTDHPSWGEFLSGFGTHREMHAMVRAGLPPSAVLRIATINGARALGVSDRLGTIEAGKYADLIVIRGDPLADITSTRNVEAVLKGGVVHDPVALLRSVQGRMGPAGVADEAWWKGSLRFGR